VAHKVADLRSMLEDFIQAVKTASQLHTNLREPRPGWILGEREVTSPFIFPDNMIVLEGFEPPDPRLRKSLRVVFNSSDH